MILINELPNVQVDKKPSNQDFLELEWYEVNKTLIKRSSKLGEKVHVQLMEKITYQDAQVIYVDEKRSLQIEIKPCLSIVLESQDLTTIGRFCFDVGNRHLPIFQIKHNQIAVSYDARLFQALKEKYKDQVRLEELKLLPNQALKPFGNFM